MATPPSVEEHLDVIHCINFNQDSKLIAVGHKDGFMYYKTSDLLDNTNLTYEGENSSNPFLTSCVVLERLFSSALMVVVSRTEPRVMHVYHSSSKNIICDHKFNKSVLTIRLNRERIVVCIEDSIFIYNLKDMKPMHNILDTPLNKLGIMDLTVNSGALLAYPGSVDTGSVHIFDAMNLASVTTFVAHEGPLAAVKFNLEGNMIATASMKGTVVRVYSVPAGARLFEFRRGVARCVTIYSLAFSPDSKYLASSSNTETIHVFKLEKPKEAESKPEPVPETSGGGWFDAINRTLAPYVYSPFQVTDLITIERSFAQTRLPGVTRRNSLAIVSHKSQLYVVAATSEGFVYCYRLDPEGGDMDLMKQHKVGPEGEGTCISPVSSGDSEVVPNMDDPDDFPPINHVTS